MKRTKIVATIGPASSEPEKLKKLLSEGVDVCRLNFSHGDHESHKKVIDTIKELRDELELPVAIMLDTKGPEIRLGEVDGRVLLKPGDQFILTSKDVLGDSTRASVSYKNLSKDIKVGSKVLIDDGLVALQVVEIDGDDIKLFVLNGGEISSHKGVNVPYSNINLPSLTQRDIDDINFGVREGVDFIAASFIRSKEDVLAIRKVLEDAGDFSTRIISKIESSQGLKNLEEIIDFSDGIMVARGDLGVEIETEDVPLAQKRIINLCNERGKAVITATQMLDSMIRNPRPTRAEASDVANAVIDGTSAVMLSGETASGAYPLQAVMTMRKIILSVENSTDFDATDKFNIKDDITDSIAKSTCKMAKDLKAEAIITATTSGFTTRAISKFKPSANIIAATPSEKVRRQLSLEWGVESTIVPSYKDTDMMIDSCVQKSIEEGFVKPGDRLIITAGVPVGLAGSTNLIKVETVSEIISKGTGIGDGEVTARVVLAQSKETLVDRFKDGDIIVMKMTDKNVMNFVERASAIVTEIAGLTSHAAVVGTSLQIPTIVGASDIFKKVNTGDIITVNAKDGTIRKGTTEIK